MKRVKKGGTYMSWGEMSYNRFPSFASQAERYRYEMNGDIYEDDDCYTCEESEREED